MSFATVLSKPEKRSQAAYVQLAPTSKIQDLLKNSADVTQLDPQARKILTEGPTVQIRLGAEIIHERYPKRLFMVLSTIAKDYFKKNILATQVVLRHGCADKHALKTILRSTTSKRFLNKQNIRAAPVMQSFIDAVKVYGAGIALGMREHVEHLAINLRNTIANHNRLLAYEELDILQTLPSSDPVFQHAALVLATLRHKKEIPDVDEFTEYLRTHRALSDAMDKHDAPHIAGRKARAKEQRQAAQQVARAAYVAQLKKEQQEKDAKLAELRGVLKERKGGIAFVSSEQAQLMRESGF